jgi:hypothetical protein
MPKRRQRIVVAGRVRVGKVMLLTVSLNWYRFYDDLISYST